MENKLFTPYYIAAGNAGYDGAVVRYLAGFSASRSEWLIPGTFDLND
jgi:hypothetical protein